MMGLFERFRKTKNIEQDALDSVERGMACEQQGQLDAALQHYEAAISLMPQLARAHFNRGNILLDRGEAQNALDAYTKAVVHKPDSAATHYNMGNAYAALGQHASAITAYQQAIRWKPEFADAYMALGGAQEELGLKEAAAQSYLSAIEINPTSADSHFYQGIEFQGIGQLDNAATCYRQVLRIQPNHIEAIKHLGTVLYFLGRYEEAAEQFRHSLDIVPNDMDMKLNLGDSLQAQGKLKDAAEYYQQVTQIRNSDAQAHIRLCVTLHQLGDFQGAADFAKRAIEITPDNASFHFNHANALREMGQLQLSQECYSKALSINPNFAEAHNNLGAIQKQLSDLTAAATSFQLATENRHDYLDAHYNLGIVLQLLGKPDIAAKSFRRALEINPNYAPAHAGYGAAQKELGELVLAKESYRRALELKPADAHAHNNLGTILAIEKKYDDAIASYRCALEIDPTYATAYMNLGGALKDVGHFDEALACVRRSLELDNECALAYHHLLFIENFLVAHTPAEMLTDAQTFGEMVGRQARPFNEWQNSLEPSRTLRIGIVSGDLLGHPVGFFLDGVLTSISSRPLAQLEFYAYATRIVDDSTSRRIRSCCFRWQAVEGMSDEQLAQRIRDDRIDILIDLAGHTANNRLAMFAWKPAPVQVSWLGYFATTGVAAIDYFIADPWTLLPSEEPNFTEQVWRLPETRLCFTPPDADIAVSDLPALTNGYVTFGCFNNLSKMNDAVVVLWARILTGSPGSHLFLKAGQLGVASVRQSIRDRFAAHGIPPDRLILEDFVPRTQYLAAYQKIDIALDPFPYTGGTTTAEALWMGIPVLTLTGTRFLSRQGVGLLMNAGLPDWIASDPDDYVARALSLTRDLPRLAALRSGLRKQVLGSPIFDAPRFARHFEQALRDMWKKWCSQQSCSHSQTEETDDGTI